MITPELIAQLRAALEAATPGDVVADGYEIYNAHNEHQIAEFITHADAVLFALLRNHAPALLDEIERLKAENAMQHSQLLEQAINVLPDRDATIERLRKELDRTTNDRNNQLDRLRAAAGHAERLRARVKELEAEVEVEEYKICSNCKYEELQSTQEPCDTCVGEEYPGWEPKERNES